MENLSPEIEEVLENLYKLRKILEQVLPKEVLDYILDLVAKDGAHRRFLQITEEEG